MDNTRIIDGINDFFSLLDECDREHEQAFEAVGRENDRIQDLLHAIEFNTDETELPELTAMLKDARVRRRKYRDIEKTTRYLKTWRERNEVGLRYLGVTLGKIEDYENYTHNRTYKPRSEGDECLHRSTGRRPEKE